jgi:YihY family inner membrane protein
MGFWDGMHRIDRYQQRHRRLSFIAAVYKKFQDDQANSLAALIAYYGFVSIFPLLLVFVTVLGFVIHGNPHEQEKVLSGALGQIPILKDPLKGGASLHRSGVSLAIGLIGSLLGGMGVTNAAQNAFNRVWHVPFKRRPDFLHSRLRGLGMLAALGSLNLISTAAAAFTTASSPGVPATIGGVIVALLFNVALFLAAFRLLTVADIELRDLWPGVLVAAVCWQILQHLGGLWAKEIKHQESLYGEFGLVLGLLAFLYLGAQLTVFAAEINVVRKRRLWPRSFLTPGHTEADRRALSSAAEIEERFDQEDVEVSFTDKQR